MALLNRCATTGSPPKELTSTKLIPLYKGKGSDMVGDNYHALSIMHPFAKLLMGILTDHLEKFSEDL